MERYKRLLSFYFLILLFVILTQAPYIYAASQSDKDFVFSGFLFNPLDGNTYLSKMRQGWEGKWLFELTYSPEKSQPAFLFVFYLLLGHLSRISHLDLLTCFHFARLLASLALLFALRNFFQWLFDDQKTIEMALLWTMFGAGLGWLVIPFGRFAPDFWIAEGYVFLSAFANPHFPLAIAIQVWMLTLSKKALNQTLNIFIAFPAGVVLANLSPFAWVITCFVLVFFLLLSTIRTDARSHRMLFFRLIFFGLGGIPFLVYQFWVVRQDIVLAEWNRQNVTPSPNFGELLIGYLPLAIWAMFGVIRGIKRTELRFMLPTIWVAVSLLLVYFPSSLQRRFLIGLYIPLVALAMVAFQEMAVRLNAHTKMRTLFFWLRLSLVLSMVTNLVIFIATFRAIQMQDQTIFLYKEEVEALKWLNQNMPRDAVVLASPMSGAFIPAWTGLRVVFGHPFESIHAAERRSLIEKFYQGKMSQQEQKNFLSKHSVHVIIWGIRERAISTEQMKSTLEQTYPVGYQNEKISIYRVTP